jgi:hypothetical protein
VLVAFGQVLMRGALAAVLIAVLVPVIVRVTCQAEEATLDEGRSEVWLAVVCET